MPRKARTGGWLGTWGMAQKRKTMGWCSCSMYCRQYGMCRSASVTCTPHGGAAGRRRHELEVARAGVRRGGQRLARNRSHVLPATLGQVARRDPRSRPCCSCWGTLQAGRYSARGRSYEPAAPARHVVEALHGGAAVGGLLEGVQRGRVAAPDLARPEHARRGLLDDVLLCRRSSREHSAQQATGTSLHAARAMRTAW
jgi:hypothetical protein